MPATHEQIAASIGDGSPWDEGVKSLIKWQFGLHGDFRQALWRAISTADESNLDRLAAGFPKEVEAFRQWSHGELGESQWDSGLPI